MKLELVRTLLSKKVRYANFLWALGTYTILLLILSLDSPLFQGNGAQVYGEGEYWRAFTTPLMHADLVHLGHNTLFYLIFSTLLHTYFGFWVFPVLSLFIGGIINLLVFKVYNPQIYLVGISGVIYFMGAFWMVMYLLIERKRKLSVRILQTLGISLILFGPTSYEPHTSYLAHGLGFLIGIVTGSIYFKMFEQKIRSHEHWIAKSTYVDPELEAQALEATGP